MNALKEMRFELIWFLVIIKDYCNSACTGASASDFLTRGQSRCSLTFVFCWTFVYARCRNGLVCPPALCMHGWSLASIVPDLWSTGCRKSLSTECLCVTVVLVFVFEVLRKRVCAEEPGRAAMDQKTVGWCWWSHSSMVDLALLKKSVRTLAGQR